MDRLEIINEIQKWLNDYNSKEEHDLDLTIVLKDTAKVILEEVARYLDDLAMLKQIK